MSQLTWNKSGYGAYYSDDIQLENVSLVLGVTIYGFSAIKETHVITPIISNDGSKIRFMSNVNVFESISALSVRVLYK